MNHLLRAAGEALYGPQWQSALARDLRCSTRTMQRYAAGTREPPPSIWQELHEMVEERRAILGEIMPDLAKAAIWQK